MTNKTKSVYTLVVQVGRSKTMGCRLVQQELVYYVTQVVSTSQKLWRETVAILKQADLALDVPVMAWLKID